MQFGSPHEAQIPHPRCLEKYGARGYRLALLEAGHAAQNLLLTAVANGLAGVPWGGFFEDALAELIAADSPHEQVVAAVAIGVPEE